MKVEIVVENGKVLIRMKNGDKHIDMVLNTDEVHEIVSRLMEANSYILSGE